MPVRSFPQLRKQLHSYDNIPIDPDDPVTAAPRQQRPQQPHYQNHFFTTIYDSQEHSDGANGFDPTASFERQNSMGELEWTAQVGFN